VHWSGQGSPFGFAQGRLSAAWLTRFARWTDECARPYTSILAAGAALLVSCTFVTVTVDERWLRF
jgi:hypothetical protein